MTDFSARQDNTRPKAKTTRKTQKTKQRQRERHKDKAKTKDKRQKTKDKDETPEGVPFGKGDLFVPTCLPILNFSVLCESAVT